MGWFSDGCGVWFVAFVGWLIYMCLLVALGSFLGGLVFVCLDVCGELFALMGCYLY